MNAFLLSLALLVPAAAQAADAVSLSSRAFVERQRQDATGNTVTTLEQPKVVVPGDKLRFELLYKNNGAAPAKDFSVTNPVPGAVAFTGSEGPAVVSVDGGKSWGPLTTLKVPGADGKLRPAQPADVTHIRWTLASPIAPGGSGSFSFRGQVK